MITEFLECDLFWCGPHPWLPRTLPAGRMGKFRKKSHAIYTNSEYPLSNMAETEQTAQWLSIKMFAFVDHWSLNPSGKVVVALWLSWGMDWSDHSEGQWHGCQSGECLGCYRLVAALWSEHRWFSSPYLSIRQISKFFLCQLWVRAIKLKYILVVQSSEKWAEAVHWPSFLLSTRLCYWAPRWPIGIIFRALWGIWLTLCYRTEGQKALKRKEAETKARRVQPGLRLSNQLVNPTSHRHQKGF